MSRIAYVNGRYAPLRDAQVNVEDRGYQFADGVYEVCEVRGGQLVDAPLHMERLQRSLRELRIRMPMTLAALLVVLNETISRNRVGDGIVYLQITRGVAHRDHHFPPDSTPPAVIVTARHLDYSRVDALAAKGIAVITVPDERWARVDIKSVSLLPNVLAKQAAHEKGAKEAWLVDRDGYVTEGSSTNAWIVTEQGEVLTRQVDRAILRGVTRTVLLKLLADRGERLTERAFTVAEARAAREAFVTSASQTVMPVVRIDDWTIGAGKPGKLTVALRAAFHRYSDFAGNAKISKEIP